jgi:hypothetical protein
LFFQKKRERDFSKVKEMETNLKIIKIIFISHVRYLHFSFKFTFSTSKIT